MFKEMSNKKIYTIQGKKQNPNQLAIPPSIKTLLPFLKFSTSNLNSSAFTQTPFFCVFFPLSQ